MKKLFKILITILFMGIVFYGIKRDLDNVNSKVVKKTIDKNSVSYNGWLRVDGNKLINQENNEIQLRGISTHGVQWYRQIYTYNNIKKLKEDWNINVLRVSMYTSPKEDGYIKNKNLKNDIIQIVDDAINLDLYVVIDWHILLDGDPTEYQDEAIEFFDEISEKYKNTPNVIFEICNEPNGDDVTWKKVKKYSEKVIKVIRKNSPNSLIIVGIPDWCKDLSSVSKNPLDFDNIMYSVHFYAGTDGKELRNKMDTFLDKGLPIFISECGMTDNTGDSKIYEDEFNEWIDYINKKNLSWIYWSFSDKEEGSSLLTMDYEPEQYYSLKESYKGIKSAIIHENFDNYLTKAGKIVKNVFKEYN